MAEKTLKVTQIKSAAARTKPVKATLKAVGLGRIGSTRIVKANPAMIGMLKKIEYLIEVSEQ